MLAPVADPWHAYAAPLATARLDAPVLYADPNGLTTATYDEIMRLRPGKIIALGTVPERAIEQAAAAASMETSTVARIAGPEPAGTAALLAGALASTEESLTVVVAVPGWITDAMGGNALAAAQDNAVLLFTGRDGLLPPEARAFIEGNRANIARTIALGGVSDAAVQGLPGVTRINRGEPYATSAAILDATRPTGMIWTFVYSPAMPVDAVVATSSAIRTNGGLPVPIHWKVLSPYTREWLENVDTRVFAATVVGNTEAEPLLVDYVLMKAIGSR